MPRTHGLAGPFGGPIPPTYISWLMMRQRCNNPKNPDYSNYGGRGILVCERWGRPQEGYGYVLRQLLHGHGRTAFWYQH